MKITKNHKGLVLLQNGRYIFHTSIIEEGPIEIDLDLPLVIKGDVRTKESIVSANALFAVGNIVAGQNIKSAGSIRSTKNIKAGGDIEVDGDIVAENILVKGNLFSSNTVNTEQDLIAGGDVKAHSEITVKGDIATNNIETELLIVDGLIYSKGSVSAKEICSLFEGN